MHTSASVPARLISSLTPTQVAVLGFLARYTGNTHDAYRYHLEQWLSWCEAQHLDALADVRRVHVELYVRHLQVDLGHKPSSVGARMSPIRGFYRFAAADELIHRDPAAYARLPRIRYQRKAPLERGELQRFLAVAKTTSPRHWALTQLLGVMALRVSEACSLDVDSWSSVERGYRILRFIGKGRRPANMPVPYPVMAALDTLADGRTAGPLFVTRTGRRLERHGAANLITTVQRRAGMDRTINPHLLRAAAITQGFDANLSTRDVQNFARHQDPRTTSTFYDLDANNYERHAVHTIAARLAV